MKTETLTLYHTGYYVIEEPDIHHGRKNADFGGSSLQNVINRIKNLKSNDAAYGCFSGLKDGKSGKSVIIIETEGI